MKINVFSKQHLKSDFTRSSAIVKIGKKASSNKQAKMQKISMMYQ